MIKRLECPAIAAPFGSYSHAIEVPPGARTLHVSGQVGADRNGAVPNDAGGQAAVIFDNLAHILTAAGMSLADLVKLTYFVCDADDLPAIRAVRDRVLPSPYPASSLMIVKALGQPEWKLEIEALAARAGA